MQFHIAISSVVVFIFMKIFMGLRVEGQKNIPRSGGLIIASNHLSNWDPPVIGVSVAMRREAFYMAKEELFQQNKFYSLLLKKYNAIPIKRKGIDKHSIRLVSYNLKKGKVFVIFPEGKRNPSKGLLKPLPGAGYLALKTKTNIIPAYIEGTAEPLLDLIKRKKRVFVRFGNEIEVGKRSKGSLLKESVKLSNFVMEKINYLSENV
jgi:1-acyl-sn-glycerol-3-phosphate acyltransferase